MHPVTAPGSKESSSKRNLMNIYNAGEVMGGIERYYYGAILNQDKYCFDDVNSNQRILTDRPIFKIIMNPKSHC